MTFSNHSALIEAAHSTQSLTQEPGTPVPPTQGRLQGEQLALFLNRRDPALARRFFRWTRARRIAQADARDALQTVLLMIARRIREGRTTPGILTAPWLFRCAMREAVRNHLRSSTVRLHEPHAEIAPGVWEQYRQTARRDQLDAVAEALDQLSEREQKVLILHQVNGQTEGEIADLFEVAQGTVSRWLARARDRLRCEVVRVLIRQGYERDELPT